MSNEYKNNHYVPVWYQKRFILPGQTDLYYLDLNPDKFIDRKGAVHSQNALRRLGLKRCFSQDDLYTTTFNAIPSQNIEKLFFGEIDSKGKAAVEYWTDFQHPSVNYEAFQSMMLYMSTQKLRTPKGLGWLADQTGTTHQTSVLRLMLKLRNLHCALWSECIWQIADASQSSTKFIISDHPVTVYNRVCGPRSQRCRGFNDPEIWLNGTHTIFPLSLDKILILTNLSWVRNPYQSETKPRPNPNPWRGALFKFLDVQILRHLTEQEVIDINYIIKRRALRYVAAAKKEWLFPEDGTSTNKWSQYGNGYMLMPDPRAVNLGGEVLIGYEDGHSDAFDAYGRKPWQPDYAKEQDGSSIEHNTLHRFQGEFARLIGPGRRGRSFQGVSLDKERDDEEFHQYHLRLDKKNRRSRKSL